jgi:hypothetical protein
MNPVNYLGCRVTARQVLSSHPHLVGPSFDLELRFDRAKDPIRLHGVYLNPEAQALIESGEVTDVSIELVKANSLSASLLKNAQCLLTGLQLQDGRTLCLIPRSILLTRRLGLLFSTALCLARRQVSSLAYQQSPRLPW